VRIGIISTMDGNPWAGSEELWADCSRVALASGDTVKAFLWKSSERRTKLDAQVKMGLDVSLRSHEDWDYWLMLVEASYRFGVTPECAANYRIVPGSMSTNMSRMYDTAIAVLKKRRTMQSHCQNCKDSWGEGHKHYARLLIYDYLCRSYLDRGVLSACRSMLAVLKRCTSSFNLCKQMVTYISTYIRSVGRGVCLKMPFIWRIAR